LSIEDYSAIERRASRIKLFLMDCDGVLTDGRLWFPDDSGETKAFHVRDGFGLELLHRSGIRSGVITGRESKTLERRARELKIEFVRQGAPNKLNAFEELLIEAAVDDGEVAFIGDDLNDIPVMKRCELAIAVADAADETRAVAHLVTEARGGHGAVREAIELILKAQGHWSEVIKPYL
jgi:3-deoxy-D-manno-octulosonate 8-phosphate phosphatase (KDO 8-P phosphatase)